MHADQRSKRMGHGSARWAPLAAAIAVVVTLAACTGSANDRPELQRPLAGAELGQQPNVVLLLSDDQVKGTLDAMPILRREIVEKGVEAENAIIPTSTCCPSRVTLLTGQYSHSNGVYNNVGRWGGWTAFARDGGEDRTVPVALQDSGYRTGFFGKYLNGWVVSPDDYVPPGWDEFMAIRDPSSSELLGANAYYNYWLTGTQEKEYFGDSPQDYSTDVLADLAVDFIEATDVDTPLFLVYSTTGVHAPFTPAPRHEGTRELEPLPDWFSNDVTGKPPWVAEEDPAKPLKTRRALRAQKEALASVDEGIGDIVSALGSRASRTLFIFMSDNGLQLGSHRLQKKYVPYTRATTVPMAMRFDAVIEPGTVLRSLVTNSDVTATIVDAANASLTGMDGRSVLDDTRESAVLEGIANSGRPPYCGVRTLDFVYIYHSGGVFEELYDYRSDPWETTNVVDRAEYAETVDRLKRSAMRDCSPTPPGFTW